MNPSASSIRDHARATACCVAPERSQMDVISEIDPIRMVARMTAGNEKRIARSFRTKFKLHYPRPDFTRRSCRLRTSLARRHDAEIFKFVQVGRFRTVGMRARLCPG